jgi:hypothetical protein
VRPAVLAGSLAALALFLAIPAEAADQPLEVETSAPASVPFADRVTLRVTVTADRDAVDASTVRIVAPVTPMTQLGPARVTRARRGDTEVVSYEVTAACMEQRCVDAKGARALELRPVLVSADGDDGVVRAGSSWPRLTVRGRTPATVRATTSEFRTDLDPPRITYRVDPDRASALLLVAAALLALTGIALGGVRATRSIRRRNDVPLTELERALLLARESERRPPPDRRRALGLLARVLGSREQTLAEDASTLAWSAPEPTVESVSLLVDDVSRTVGAR